MKYNTKVENANSIPVLDRLERSWWLMNAASIIAETAAEGNIPKTHDPDEVLTSVAELMWEAQQEVGSVVEAFSVEKTIDEDRRERIKRLAQAE